MTDEELLAEEYADNYNIMNKDLSPKSPRHIITEVWLDGLKAGEEKAKKEIELMKCCQNCKHFDFDEPKYCHKGVYNCAYVCDKYELGN